MGKRELADLSRAESGGPELHHSIQIRKRAPFGSGHHSGTIQLIAPFDSDQKKGAECRNGAGSWSGDDRGGSDDRGDRGGCCAAADAARPGHHPSDGC